MSDKDLSDMTLYELRELARQQGVAGFSHARKSQLVTALDNGYTHVLGPGYGSGPRSYKKEQEQADMSFKGPGNYAPYNAYENDNGSYGSYDSDYEVGQSRYAGSSQRYGRVGHSNDYNNLEKYGNYSSSYNYGAGVGNRRVGWQGNYNGSYGSRDRRGY